MLRGSSENSVKFLILWKIMILWKIIKQLLVSTCGDFFSLLYVVPNTRKTFVWFVIASLYAVILREQRRITLAERRKMAACLPSELFVFFPLSKCLEGRSLLCQSQAIRANGSPCLYGGRVWGLLFPGIGHFLFPGSWKTPGSENTLYSPLADCTAQGSRFPTVVWPEAETLFFG